MFDGNPEVIKVTGNRLTWLTLEMIDLFIENKDALKLTCDISVN
jgi:hypothetical protein